MRKTIWWLLLIAGLVLLAAIPYYSTVRHPGSKSDPGESPISDAPPPSRPATVGPQYPLPLPALETPLPALDTSDATLRNSVRALWGDKAVDERFQFKDFIRRVVATIDNLPRRKVAVRLMPVRPVEGAFAVTGNEDGYTMAPENARRYTAYIALLEAVTPSQLVSLYMRLYPLFQQAYEDLGYPGQYFNDRLIAVIDDALDAPDIAAPPTLLRPKVFYVYADPELEASSAGQKVLMRMGSENAARVKSRLRAIRAELEKQASSMSRSR
ncbi:MAG: DUF3014 domain-containing protein [Rhodospirillaceae bacterium]